jgi:hypothetical protein
MKTALLALPALLLLLAGCPPADEGGSPDGLIHAEWDEDDDTGNNNPGDPEPVDVQWTGSVTIHGEADDCGYDYQTDDWPWTGDEDYYEVEVPEDGYMDATLTWNNSSELDMHVYFEPPSGMTISPDEILYSEDDAQEIEYLFPEESDGGDYILVVMLCRSGGGGAYDLRVGWDD